MMSALTRAGAAKQQTLTRISKYDLKPSVRLRNVAVEYCNDDGLLRDARTER